MSEPFVRYYSGLGNVLVQDVVIDNTISRTSGAISRTSGLMIVRDDEIDLNSGRFSLYSHTEQEWSVIALNANANDDSFIQCNDCVEWISENCTNPWSLCVKEKCDATGQVICEQIAFSFASPIEASAFKIANA